MFAPPPDKILMPSNVTINSSFFDLSVFKKEIVVGVCMSNNASTIRRCLKSIIEQDIFYEKVALILLNDSSCDEWETEVRDFQMLLF
jgi:hypothetical protein